jgi:hypothetical protein
MLENLKEYEKLFYEPAGTAEYTQGVSVENAAGAASGNT